MSNEFNNKTIAFIGAGNMARSIIGGLVANGFVATNIIAANPSMGKLESLSQDFNVVVTQDNLKAVKDADMVVMAVKPQMMKMACEQLAAIKHKLAGKLFVSLAVGVSAQRIRSLLTVDVPVIRCMPNTPSLFGKGVSGLFASGINDQQKAFTDYVIGSTGLTVWVEQEQQIDAITAVSGSGPAYFFLFMEAMVAKAQQLGFDEATARQLVQHTATGAATMVEHSELSIAQLRQNVTSKGGTTAAALAVFETQNLTQLVDEAMQAATDRAQVLGETLN
jgi:pyrroline-5-carboxylate reductase